MVIYVRSPFGHSLKGVRESESRMRVLAIIPGSIST